MEEPTPPACSYVGETDQMRPYDGDSDVATAQDARDSLNEGAGSNLADDAVDIEQLNDSVRELSLLESSDHDDADSGSVQQGQDDEQPQLITTQKGHPKLCYHGYIYHLHAKRPRDGLRWRCKERLLKCGGTLLTDVLMKNPHPTVSHNHAADNSAVLVAAEVVKMKKRAAETREKPSVILAHSQTPSRSSRTDDIVRAREAHPFFRFPSILDPLRAPVAYSAGPALTLQEVDRLIRYARKLHICDTQLQRLPTPYFDSSSTVYHTLIINL